MWRAVLVVVLALAARRADAETPPISAQPSDAFLRGEVLYKAGDHLAAAASFEEAYALDRDPATLFNIAQAYRLGKACAKAADYYRRFLAAVRDPPNADVVREHIAQQDRCATHAPDQAARSNAAPPPDARADRGPTRRRIGVAIGVAGLAAVGAGAYLTWRVSDLERARDRCLGCTLPELRAIDDRGHRAETLQVVAYAAGGAAIAGGVVLYMLGRASREVTRVAIMPGPTVGSVVGAIRF